MTDKNKSTEEIKIDYLTKAMDKFEDAMDKRFSRVHDRINELDGKMDLYAEESAKKGETIKHILEHMDRNENSMKWLIRFYISTTISLIVGAIYIIIEKL